MSKIKSAFYYTILYQTEIEETEEGGAIDVSLAREMLNTIDQLEYELALFHSGCDKEEVKELMRKTYKPMDERYS